MSTKPTPALALRRHVLRATLAASALLLSACATLGPQTPEQVVTQRVEARWDAMIAGDFKTAWSYSQPSFRAIVKAGDYAKRFGSGGQWEGVQVHAVNCAAERCTVRLRVTSKLLVQPFVGQQINAVVDEEWIREDGQWWFFQAL